MTGAPAPRWSGRASVVAALLVGALVGAACSGSEEGSGASTRRSECIPVDVTVSSEKIQLLGELAESFNASGANVEGTCVDVQVTKMSSGAAATALAEGWDVATDGPRPTIWSPAASSWGQVLNARLAAEGRPPLVAEQATSFMLTPLVIAMPKPMAEALGWPEQPVGWADILRLANSPTGWADLGHPEWGAFELGKTNPNFSTSGLSALIAQSYAATGKTAGLSSEDLANPQVVQFGTDIESSVVHYGDITMTFLNNWFRADRRGTALNYASAVAVEEKSVIDYNRGDPDGVLEQGEQLRPPRIPLVAIYPTEGTIYSDNPLYVMEADWVTPQQRAGAEQFEEFVLRPENQQRALAAGFRPGTPAVAIHANQ